jgi:hypothetical protein
MASRAFFRGKTAMNRYTNMLMAEAARTRAAAESRRLGIFWDMIHLPYIVAVDTGLWIVALSPSRGWRWV